VFFEITFSKALVEQKITTQPTPKAHFIHWHYILAGGTRVGVETIAADSGGTITADTLRFFVHDEVGSVIATVTESLGGANQALALYSYDA